MYPLCTNYSNFLLCTYHLLLSIASHLYCMCMICVVPTFLVTLVQLMRPGIGWNASCALGDCLISYQLMTPYLAGLRDGKSVSLGKEGRRRLPQRRPLVGSSGMVTTWSHPLLSLRGSRGYPHCWRHHHGSEERGQVARCLQLVPETSQGVITTSTYTIYTHTCTMYLCTKHQSLVSLATRPERLAWLWS